MAISIFSASASVKYLLVVLGGGLGSLARYVAGTAITTRFASLFPLGTMVINITGSFLIGLLMTLLSERLPASPLAPAAGGRLSGRLYHLFQFRMGDLQRRTRRRLLDRSANVAGSVSLGTPRCGWERCWHPAITSPYAGGKLPP